MLAITNRRSRSDRAQTRRRRRRQKPRVAPASETYSFQSYHGVIFSYLELDDLVNVEAATWYDVVPFLSGTVHLRNQNSLHKLMVARPGNFAIPGVTHLKLRRELAPCDLAKIPKVFPNLRELNLKYINIGEIIQSKSDISWMTEPRLEKLCIRKCQFFPEHLQELLKLLPGLRELDLELGFGRRSTHFGRCLQKQMKAGNPHTNEIIDRFGIDLGGKSVTDVVSEQLNRCPGLFSSMESLGEVFAKASRAQMQMPTLEQLIPGLSDDLDLQGEDLNEYVMANMGNIMRGEGPLVEKMRKVNMPSLMEQFPMMKELTKSFKKMLSASRHKTQPHMLQKLSIAVSPRDLPRIHELFPDLRELHLKGYFGGYFQHGNTGMLPQLTKLVLDSTDLQPTDLEQLAKLFPRLRCLSLGGNEELGGAISSMMPRIPHLESLVLDATNLQPSDLKQLPALFPGLRSLSLGENEKLGGAISSTMPRLPHLEILYLGSCELEPTDLEPLADLFPKLRFLSFAGNKKLGGVISSAMPQMPRLEKLDLYSTELEPADLEPLENLFPKLRCLSLGRNEKLSDSVNSRMSRMPPLEKLILDATELEPTVLEPLPCIELDDLLSLD